MYSFHFITSYVSLASFSQLNTDCVPECIRVSHVSIRVTATLPSIRRFCMISTLKIIEVLFVLTSQFSPFKQLCVENFMFLIFFEIICTVNLQN